jgi:hypothetical protein
MRKFYSSGVDSGAALERDIDMLDQNCVEPPVRKRYSLSSITQNHPVL